MSAEKENISFLSHSPPPSAFHVVTQIWSKKRGTLTQKVIVVVVYVVYWRTVCECMSIKKCHLCPVHIWDLFFCVSANDWKRPTSSPKRHKLPSIQASKLILGYFALKRINRPKQLTQGGSVTPNIIVPLAPSVPWGPCSVSMASKASKARNSAQALRSTRSKRAIPDGDDDGDDGELSPVERCKVPWPKVEMLKWRRQVTCLYVGRAPPFARLIFRVLGGAEATMQTCFNSSQVPNTPKVMVSKLSKLGEVFCSSTAPMKARDCKDGRSWGRSTGRVSTRTPSSRVPLHRGSMLQYLHERNIECESMQTIVSCSLRYQFCPCPFFPYISFFLLSKGTVSLHTEAYWYSWWIIDFLASNEKLAQLLLSLPKSCKWKKIYSTC